MDRDAMLQLLKPCNTIEAGQALHTVARVPEGHWVLNQEFSTLDQALGFWHAFEEDNRMAIQSLAEVFVAEFYIVGYHNVSKVFQEAEEAGIGGYCYLQASNTIRVKLVCEHKEHLEWCLKNMGSEDQPCSDVPSDTIISCSNNLEDVRASQQPFRLTWQTIALKREFDEAIKAGALSEKGRGIVDTPSLKAELESGVQVAVIGRQEDGHEPLLAPASTQTSSVSLDALLK